MKSIVIALLLFAPFPALAQEITISGTMHHSTLEGGCWYLQGDGGKRFELIGDTGIVYPLRIEGQHIVINAMPVKNGASVCMIGEIVRVLQRIDTVRYPIDLPVAPITLVGTIHRSKTGVWYVKTSQGREYEFQQPPASQYRRIGAMFNQKVRILLDKKSTKTGKDGVILSIPFKPRALQKKYDAR
ncbi:MAG: hypothetical protein ACHQNE_10375 [Candidatus Kapaibacterium sp.]